MNFPLSLFAKKKGIAVKEYLIFMDETETKEIKSMAKEEESEAQKRMENHSKITKEALIKMIEKFTGLKIEQIKGNTKRKRISDIRKLYIKNLKKYSDVPNKGIADLLDIEQSTVSNVLSGRYQENDFIVRLTKEIERNVKL